MGASVKDVYNSLMALARKNQSGGYVSPTQFNNMARVVQDEMINGAVSALDANRTASAILSSVTKRTPVAFADGKTPVPSDYRRIITLFGKSRDGKWISNEAETVGLTELGERLRNTIDAPTANYPVVCELPGFLEIHPENIRVGELVYVYDYPDPVYAVTGDPPVFDPAASVDFVVDATFVDRLVYGLCVAFGISVRDPLMIEATKAG